MKYQTTAVLIAAAISLFYASFELGARGRGGGGGGGDRGGGFNRTPSMSREGRPDQSIQARSVDNRGVDNRAVENRAGNDFRGAPSAQNIQGFLRPTTSRDNLHQFMNPASATNIENRTLDGRNFSQLQGTNRLAADRVRNDLVRNNPTVHGMFNNEFFRNHGVPYYLAGGALTRAGDWNSMANWLSWGGGVAPLYYDDTGYATAVPASAITETSVQPSSSTSATVQNIVPTNPDWMNLGVFVLGQDATQLANSTMFLQLALKKDGTIAGTYYNTATNKTYVVDGVVDQTTQQAAWKLNDSNYTTLMKTGLYNLTQPQSPVTVQFANGTVELWQMVRMQE